MVLSTLVFGFTDADGDVDVKESGVMSVASTGHNSRQGDQL